MKVGDLVIEKRSDWPGEPPRIGIVMEMYGPEEESEVGWVLWNGNFDWEVVYQEEVEPYVGQNLTASTLDKSSERDTLST
jgi:hypothetical protein